LNRKIPRSFTFAFAFLGGIGVTGWDATRYIVDDLAGFSREP
jgi:hypothetical protein